MLRCPAHTTCLACLPTPCGCSLVLSSNRLTGGLDLLPRLAGHLRELNLSEGSLRAFPREVGAIWGGGAGSGLAWQQSRSSTP